MAKKGVVKHKIRSLGLVLGAVLVLGGVVYAGAQFGRKPIVAADGPTGDVKSVIVKFKDASPVTSSASASKQQSTIEEAQEGLAEAIPYSEGYKLETRTYKNLPYAVYTVDAAGEASLKADPTVEAVFDNQILESLADTPIPTIGGSATGVYTDSSGSYTGSGYAVAVIDTGVDKNHPLLAGVVVAEACFGENATYSNATVESLCPGGATFSSASGSGQDCTLPGCGHGTQVAGAAAMPVVTADIDSDSVNDTLVGSAKGAKVIAIKIASKITSATICPSDPANECAKPVTSQYLAALDYVATLSVGMPIASANLSIGSTTEFYANGSSCAANQTAQAFTAAATSLRAHNIAPVVAAGNHGNPSTYPQNVDKISVPACANGAISVAATNVLGTQLSSYSNNAPGTTLLAPGGSWDGVNNDSILWYPENGTTTLSGTQGTSFAAPIVAGAYAVLREKHPNATVDQLTTLLQNSGTNVTDNRAGYTVGAKKRINVANALSQSPMAVINTFSGPSGTVNAGNTMTLTATVTNAASCSLNQGVGNVAISGGAISATVPTADSYILTCLNGYGDSVQQTRNFTLNPAPTTPVVSAANYDKNAQTFTFTWGASTDADGVDEYRVYLNGQQMATLPATEFSYTFTGLLPDVSYTAEVRAVDVLGAISTAASATFGNGAETTIGTPNTGLLSAIGLEGKGYIVALLGLIAAITLIVVVKKRSTR